MEIFDKFNAFVIENYEPVEEQPEYDRESEFIVEISFTDDMTFWYGPISFDDLDVFVGTLPEGEATLFIAAVKGVNSLSTRYI